MIEPKLVAATEPLLDQVIQLNSLSSLEVWSSESFRNCIHDESFDFQLMLLGDERLTGFYLSRWIGSEAELIKIAVAPRCRGRGYGAFLLKNCLLRARRAGCRHCFLEVRSSNGEALQLYEKEGFRHIGLRRRYYRNPTEDALILKADLRQSTGVPEKG